MDICGAALTPCAGAWTEDAWRLFDERALLLRRQLHHPPVFTGVAEGRKYFSGSAEIRMIHVGGFRHMRIFEGHFPKSVCGHIDFLSLPNHGRAIEPSSVEPGPGLKIQNFSALPGLIKELAWR